MSLVFGAAAFGWIGVAIGAVGLLIFACAELYREAAKLSRERARLQSELENATKSTSVVRELEAKNDDLEQNIDKLRKRNREPALGPEHLLQGITGYLSQVGIVRKHRALRGQVKDAPITRLELVKRKVTVSAVCPEGAELLSDQPVAFIEARSERAFGSGLVISAASTDVRAIFDLAELPTELASELGSQDAFSPQGYVLRLVGLCFENYVDIDDQELVSVDDALTKAREVLTTILLPKSRRDPAELLDELESGLLEGGEGESVLAATVQEDDMFDVSQGDRE
jgi:hypothetical protein